MLRYLRIVLIVFLTVTLLGHSLNAQDMTPTESPAAVPTETIPPTETATPTDAPTLSATETLPPTDTPTIPPTATLIPTDAAIPTTEPPTPEQIPEITRAPEATATLDWTATALPDFTLTPTLPSDVEAQEYRGRLYFAQTHYSQCMSSVSHQWYYWLPSDNTYNPYLIDIQPVSGSGPLRYDMVLTGPGVNMSAPSSVDGRGILYLSSGGGDYNLYLYPRAGSNGCYNIAIWATSIPKLDFSWGFQSAYSNITRWQFYFGATYTYYIEVQRTEGNLEYSYSLVNRSTGQTIPGTAGNSYRGNAVSAAISGAGWYDFYINPGSTQGSYRIAIVQGIRPIDPPRIMQPAANQMLTTRPMTVALERSVGNGRGTPQFNLQIINTDTNQVSFEQTSVSETFANINLPNGRYKARTCQGNGADACSGWSTEVPFLVSVIQPPVLLNPPNGAAVSVNPPALQWSISANAARYELQLGKTNPPAANVYSGPNTSYTPLNPMVAGTYFWRVRAFDSTNYASEWSEIRSFSLQSPANAAPLLNYSPSNITLSWTRVTWAAGYAVEIDDSSLFTLPLIYNNPNLGPDTLELTPDALPPGTYYWRVRPRKADGTHGAWSTNGAGTFTIDIP